MEQLNKVLMVMRFVILGLFIALLLLVCNILPFHDDWSYATAPNVDFVWRQLLPGDAFWRPFDVLWGVVMGRYPVAFPFANKAMIILGHCLNAILLYSVLKKLCSRNKSGTVLGVIFFAISSAIAATIVNTDTINQVWSFFCGVLAIRLAQENKMILSYVMIVGSILFKESGVSWLAVMPIVVGVKVWKRWGIGASILAGYLGIRFVLCGGIKLGGGYYELGFNPIEIIKGLVIAIGLPMSGIDGLALIFDKWIVFGASVTMSLFFWLMIALCRARLSIWMMAMVIAIMMAIPHCCFAGHHPAEMHFYPVLFAGAWLMAHLEMKANRFYIMFGILIVLNMMIWYDKMATIYARSDRTKDLLLELEKRQIDYSKPVYFVIEPDYETKSYSVFSQSSAHGVDFGGACRMFNGWKDFERYVVEMKKESEIPNDAQIVRIK